MRAALALLRENAPSGKGRRIAVLGDMLELGRHSKRLHLELAEPIKDARTDKVFLSGPEMKALAESFAG